MLGSVSSPYWIGLVLVLPSTSPIFETVKRAMNLLARS